ncbi:NADH dehydrogenase (quinone) [Desulfotomaculum nigrificans CO-1-SRB]|uniref:NADH dehydrogenase (Quinone) n=1 Tax=Desulfotomaculum nigrificans (strain DSM 14880 / VKM B-2319 / CO-1-SRB) TaxID=868595 RepID=F6B9J8_DESCC|nr:NADH-quinone oxidoreductase subunit NuoE [Desulfotomaculum nigrificans]AEF94894.1 NADH dehydrogenase (quinone) [Desulfotomaculum nigrificans CO-1-SRB]
MSLCCCNQNNQDKQKSLAELLTKYKEQPGALIPVLQQAQEIFGYLGPEVIDQIAGELKIPPARVYGVATFYAQFHLQPRGRHVIKVCQGTACHVRGGAKVLEAIKKQTGLEPGETSKDLRYTLETVACLGACGLAPVMMVNEDTQGQLSPEKAVKKIAQCD